ncbi:hypothetical protein HO173_006069 [Letharia columbiana]|uniref:Grh/CP2 DB domain-containing protein n=1 Tax=Letharia columbiana TaxID=112416 RepID=A0A8H6FW24_9LECA|nr:uncharacterized protein HO173_006069 [Letharia columbiana]KAF6235873.1 hypothetical protein HO173_006069 [Letharia columbiana]
MPLTFMPSQAPIGPVPLKLQQLLSSLSCFASGGAPRSWTSNSMPDSGRTTLMLAPELSVPIHLSVTESERIIRSRRKEEADAQHDDTTVAPISRVPWLSLENVVSVAPTPFMTDEPALRRPLVAQRQQVEECNQPTVVGSSQPLSPATEHDMWSEFILPESLSTSEAIWSCDFQDFPSPLTPQTSFPDTLSSASPDLQPLSPLACEDVASPDCVDVVESHEPEIVDSFYQKIGSTGSALSVQPSNEARFCHKLHAPPALMLKGSGESPVTYLNKGSHYSISVEDTLRAGPDPGEVEKKYVDPHESDHPDHGANSQVVHSDGFSLMWSADHSDMRQFSIAFRLNFRSTDFSHCKGVMGVAMQLCSKTEEISTTSVQSLRPNLEMSFCRIKSFRSHGAERKNANDMAIGEKRIRRLKQQLAQSQTRQTPKDKRLGRDKSKTLRPSGARRNHEDGILCKIKILQQNCTSTPPYTLLDQQGKKQQDCDWPPLGHKDKPPESPETGPASSSSASRSALMPITSRPKHSMLSSQPTQLPTPPRYDESQQRTSTRDLPEGTRNRSTRPGGVKIALFYIRPVGFKHVTQIDHYITVYLFERTSCDLTRKIAEAVSIDPGEVGQTTWSTVEGLTILVDADVVANMMEGQEMQIEAKSIATRSDSGRQLSCDSADEVYSCEHGVRQCTRELLEFNLVF